MTTLLDLQIGLIKERLTELRERRKIHRAKGKRNREKGPGGVTSSRQGTAFALRTKGLTWVAVGTRLGISGSRASQLFNAAERLYRRRKRTPRFYRLDGVGWVAWNCDEWFRSSHPANCVRKDYSFPVDFHPLAG